MHGIETCFRSETLLNQPEQRIIYIRIFSGEHRSFKLNEIFLLIGLIVCVIAAQKQCKCFVFEVSVPIFCTYVTRILQFPLTRHVTGGFSSHVPTGGV